MDPLRPDPVDPVEPVEPVFDPVLESVEPFELFEPFFEPVLACRPSGMIQQGRLSPIQRK